MEQIPTTSSGENATDAPTAGPSSTPPTPVQPSDNNCIDEKLQAVSESEYRDEPDQMYLPGSEEDISKVGSSGLDPADDIDTEQSIDGDPDTHRQLEALLQAVGSMLSPNETAATLTRKRADTKNENKTLVEACRDNDVGAVRKLLTEGHSVNETSEEGESLLSLACSAGYYELAEVLLAMQANVEYRGTKRDYTPLMKAASSGSVEIVRLLLIHGAVVNALSSTGNTPLMYACAGGHVEIVKVLLNHGAIVEYHNKKVHRYLKIAASDDNITVENVLNQI